MTTSEGARSAGALIVEDEPDIRRLLRDQLRAAGVEATTTATVAEALDLVGRERFGVVVLDLGLPDGSGLEVVDALQRTGTECHVIVVSGEAAEGDRIRALERGADDYVVKPFSLRELTARVLAARRRREGRGAARLEAGPLTIDMGARRATIDGRPLVLAAKELDLLAHLAARPGRVVSRDELLRTVWRSASEWQQPATVTEHVRRLRAKIEEDPARPRILVTVRGAGYRFDLPGADRGHRVPPVSSASPLHDLLVGVLEGLADAVIVTDLDLRVHGWNRAAERLYGRSQEEARGRHMTELVGTGGDDGGALAAAWKGLARCAARGHEGAATPVGEPASLSTSLVRDREGAPIGILSVDGAATPGG